MWIIIVIAILCLGYKIMPLMTKRLEKNTQKLRQERLEMEAQKRNEEQAHREMIQEMSLEEVQRNADLGKTEYQAELANRYYYGNGGVEGADKAKSFFYTDLAVKGGYTKEAYQLGRFYEEGIPGTVEKDDSKAAEIFYQGAIKGDPICRETFALRTFQDPTAAKYGHAEEAYQWLLESADKTSDGDVEECIARLFAAMNPTVMTEPITPEHALRESWGWMNRAAEKSNVFAMDTLALAYATGDYLQYQGAVAVDMDKAKEYAIDVWEDETTQMLRKLKKPTPYSNYTYVMALLEAGDPEKYRICLKDGARHNNKYCIAALERLNKEKEALFFLGLTICISPP